MDPVTIILVFFVILVGGGGARSAANTRRRKRRVLLKDAVRERHEVANDVEVSLFDVFWDLGVNEYALDVMGNQRLLLKEHTDLATAIDNLREAIHVEGSYSEFIRETLETIEEFYVAHKKAGNRRKLPQLEVRKTKTLELPAITSNDKPKDSTALAVVNPTGSFMPVVAKSFDERVDARSGAMMAPLVTASGPTGILVDIDDLVALDPGRLISGLFDGSIGNQISRWKQTLDLRDRRDALDRELTRFYRYYATQAQTDSNFYKHLYDVGHRWDKEIKRVERLMEREAWADKPWADCAEVLMNEALAVSRQLAWLARNNVDQTIERIHDHARRNDTAMAGYLVYLNRHAFFAGRGDEYAELARRVETATYRIQEEVSALERKGVV